jgi:histidyl-tRNA synthetase
VTFSSLRGFRDYPPPDAGARSELLRRMRAGARRSGFVELETPSVESLELFKVKSGEEIADELWAFEDKGQRPVTLVAETTPSLARVFVDRAKSEPLPVKWFTISKLWRYEEPQAGREREFSQFNLDILGVPGVEAEVEVLSAAALVLDEAGARDLYAFRLNDRVLAESLGRHLGATDGARYFRALDRSRKLPRADFERELAAAGLPDARAHELLELLRAAGAGAGGAQAVAFLDRLEALGLPAPASEGIARLRRIFELLPRVGLADRVVFDPTVVRGLAYYTSSVFEAFAREGDARALFGGGRYDHLVELFGGPPTPACGLAIGDQTLEILLRSHGRWPEGEPPLDTYVVAVSANEVPVAFDVVRSLRAEGTSADLDLLGRSMSRQLREAARRRARRALIVGPKELERGCLLERDLATGTQREIPWPSAPGPA